MGAYKRYREFGGKEQRAESRVREFRKFGTASLRGITVLMLDIVHLVHKYTPKTILFLESQKPEIQQEIVNHQPKKHFT